MRKVFVKFSLWEDLESNLQSIQRDYEVVQVVPNVHTEPVDKQISIITDYVIVYREVDSNPYDKVNVV